MLGFVSSPFSWAKNYLSHVRETSWHYKLVKSVWGQKAPEGKACSYYWLKLPSSLLALAGLFLFVVIFGTLVIGGGWFFGFIPTIFKTEDPYLKSYLADHYREPSWYPYGYTSKGKKRHIFPWQVALVGIFFALSYYLGFENQTAGAVVGISTGSVVGGFLVLGVFIFLISKSWKTPALVSARKSVKSAWDKACPPLVVEPASESKQQSELTS